MVNHMVMATMKKSQPGVVFKADNEVCHIDKLGDDVATHKITIGQELLARHQCNGLPLQNLWIKRGAIMMVMRNIDLANGLANGKFHTNSYSYFCEEQK